MIYERYLFWLLVFSFIIIYVIYIAEMVEIE